MPALINFLRSTNSKAQTSEKGTSASTRTSNMFLRFKVFIAYIGVYCVLRRLLRITEFIVFCGVYSGLLRVAVFADFINRHRHEK
jgi:hypothetical protein